MLRKKSRIQVAMKKVIMDKIKFGTDGWRAVINEDFTSQNVQLVAQAFVKYLKEANLADLGIAIGYDNRLNSEKFALDAAEICSGAGIKTYLTERSVPTPVISYSVKNMGLGAGIMITASHNPPNWNGFKIKEAFGGSAFPETTKAVESNLSPILSIKPSKDNIKLFDPDPEYFKQIKSLVNIEKIKEAGITMVVDAMHGSGAGYFKRLGLDVIEIRGNIDTTFGGINPEPIPANLNASVSYMKNLSKEKTGACIVLDGDADRLAAIDITGEFINTHKVFVLLLKHLFENRKMTGDVIKTFNLSNLINKLCINYKLKLKTTPIGFKHIAKEMIEGDVLLGGEESGGMGIKGNIPERDGILAGLNLFELMAETKMNLGKIMENIMQKDGYYYYDRIDVHTQKAIQIVDLLKNSPPDTFAGLKIASIETLDGLKFNFIDESWILFRASGTEPLLRIYAEGRSQGNLNALLSSAKEII